MDHARNAAGAVESNPGKCIKVTWYITVLLCCIDIIVAIASAAQNDQSATGSSAAAFAAVWTLFILLIVCVMGTVIIHKYHSPLAVGCFMGVSTMMSQLMLVLFGVFLAESKDATGNEKDGDQAFAAFSFILFLLFLIFACVLGRYRSTIISTVEAASSKEMGGWSNDAVPAADGVALSNHGTPV